MAGKLRMARKATKLKGKKGWKKGYSSSSNPETKKHREQAKRGFFHKQGEGNLTEALLAQHDAHQGIDDGELDEEIGDSQSIGGKTFKTFASDWSNCTNPSFNRLMKNWQANSAQHKEMLAVVAAVTEVIKEKQGKESETEYFAALMTTLESVESEESRVAVITLLGMVMKRLPPSVLKLKFSAVSKVFVGLLTSGTEHPSALRNLIGCQSVLLRAQEPAVWGHSSTLQIYGVLLSFVINPKPKVRKAAQHAVVSILTNSVIMTQPKPPPYHPAASMTAKFCCQKLEECGGSGAATTITLHILGLLKNVLNCFSKSDLKTTCETVIRVMTLGNPIVTCCSLQVFVGLFSSRPNETILTTELSAQLINALYDYQPNANDVQPQKSWLLVMKSALIYLYNLDSNLCISHVVKFIGIAVKCWLSDKVEIMSEATRSIESVLESTVKPFISDCPKDNSKITAANLQKIVQTIEGCLKYQYHSSWGHILKVTSTLINVAGKNNASLFINLLRTLADTRETHQFAYISQVDHAFGFAVKIFGPKVVLQAVPFKINEIEDRLDFPKSWLIPVIRDNVKETELQFFIKYFVPLAERLKKKVTELNEADRKIEAKTCEILYSQIWSMLPGFCTMPTDLTESFKTIAQTLGMSLTKNPDLRLHILSALRILIKKNLNNESNRNELARFAKNYLPILFNLYTTEATEGLDKSVHLAVYDTIKVYLKITDPERIQTLFQIAFDQLQAPNIQTFNRHALLDLTRALLPYLDVKSISSLFKHVTPLLEHEDKTIQKKSYRVMEELCQAESENCKSFVKQKITTLQKLFLGAISKAAPSSKAPRLRCLTYIVSQLTEGDNEFVAEVVPEAVLCTKENAVKARQAAFQLLVAMGKVKQRWSTDSFTEYIQMILAGLAGTPHIISATVLALGKIFYEFKDSLSRELIDALVENTCLLMTSKSREIILSVLSFFKTLLGSVSPDNLLQYIPSIVKSLTEISNDNHRHFRFKSKELFTKLVRLYGFESISKMVPRSHEKMLTHIRKTEARKKRDKETSKATEDDDDSDDEFSLKKTSDNIEDILEDSDAPMSDDETEVKRPKKTAKRRRNEAWIEEGGDEIVDFLDPAVNRKVTATKPVDNTRKKNNAKNEFKTAPDGRLIITEEDDDDDDDEKPAKRNAPDLGDITEAVETMSLKGMKRKRDEDSDEEEETRASFKGSGKGIRRDINKPKVHDGAKYKSKKAAGDIKKKGQLDPYAYIPLDRQALNRRKRAKYDKHFATVVKSARKGAQKGSKMKRKNK